MSKGRKRRSSPQRHKRLRLWRFVGVVLLCGGVLGVWKLSGRKRSAPSPSRPTHHSIRLPPAVRSRFTKALSLLAEKRYGKAEALLRRILPELGSSSNWREGRSLIHYNFCVALQKQGKQDVAFEEAMGFLRSCPEDRIHNAFVGSCLYDQKRYREATTYLERGLAEGWEALGRYCPDPAAVACQLADCYRYGGKNQEAARVIHSVLSRAPAHKHARKIQAFLAMKRRDFAAALPILADLHSGGWDDESVVSALATSAMELGKVQVAVDAIRKHWKRTAQRSDALRLTFSKALLQAGRAKEAVTEVAQLFILKPETEEAYLILADALSRSGLRKEAVPFRKRYRAKAQMRALLEKAEVAQRAGYPASASYYRGCAYQAGGLLARALLQLQQARRLSPLNGQVVAAVASVLEEMDRTLDGWDLLSKFEKKAREKEFPLPGEFFLSKGHIALARGNPQAAFQAVRDVVPEERIMAQWARLAARLALTSGKIELLKEVLSRYGTSAQLDPEVRALAGTAKFLSREAGGGLEDLSRAIEAFPEVPPVYRLAYARALKAAGKSTESARELRRLIAGEEFLPQAWRELSEVSADLQEKDRAGKWLARWAEAQLLLKQQWEALRGVEDSKQSARLLLPAAQVRFSLGMTGRARAILRVARFLDRWNPDIHRAVLTVFTSPEEAFDRIHSLEALVRLVPSEKAFRAQLLREYRQLGFRPPRR